MAKDNEARRTKDISMIIKNVKNQKFVTNVGTERRARRNQIPDTDNPKSPVCPSIAKRLGNSFRGVRRPLFLSKNPLKRREKKLSGPVGVRGAGVDLPVGFST